MKGIILAGGEGTRLYPCTIAVNKHLLPVYDQPMIYYPIQTLVKAGVTDLLVVLGSKSTGDFMKLLKNGQDFGLKSILYAYQDTASGIAGALQLARGFIGTNEKFCMMLGDNIIWDDVSVYMKLFLEQPYGEAKVFLKEIENPVAFGVAEVKDHRVVDIVEKPLNPKTNLAVIGLYMYDSEVFKIIDSIKPSGRGELEITDVNREYINRGHLTYAHLDSDWLDTGTFSSLHEANNIIAQKILYLK